VFPTAAATEALVRVAAISLNRGETRRAMEAAESWHPGWDLAGVIEQAAADGSGPPAGARVVGLVRSGAWAEYAAVPTDALAALPDAVTFTQAATLPVAGLTALYSLAKRGLLLNRRVCVTGATGGVGDFAIQLAHRAGAEVVAQVRRPDHAAAVVQVGADAVVIGEDTGAFAQRAPYDLVLESVGGQCLTAALATLAQDGVCVTLGGSASHEATCDFKRFRQTGRTTLYGFMLFEELALQPASVGLAHLAGLIAAGRLQPTIGVEAPWTQIGKIARQLLERKFVGKAVLHLATESF
jgi:NADPH:quinone reductase-like Zn-dependent oxidoreductase